MKIYNPARWGIVLALLSTPLAVVVAQTQTTCSTLEECPDTMYCNSVSNTCLEFGKCVEVDDCDDPTNFPYASVLCVGTTTCNGGLCGIDCGVFPPEEADEFITEKKIKCSSHDECLVYCASDGYCETTGACATAEDCEVEENQGYPLDLCIGKLTCENRMCGIKCGDFSKSETCDSHSECTGNQYCASDGVCEKIGGCATAKDCEVEENQGYPIAACMGVMQCSNRQCGMDCSGGSDALYACLTSEDCVERDTYCNNYEFCSKNGSCITDEDCSMPGNNFMEIECVGTRYCSETGMCAKTCDGFESPRLTCNTSSDCSDGEYCAGNGVCLEMGWCDQVEDCTNLGNEIMFPACVGTITCESGQCGKTCDTFCTSDDECNNSITTATTRSAPGETLYCAQGVCKKQGSCVSDNDCMNPSNILWNDKRCMGYLHCRDGLCDRECGVDCKNGSKAAQCFEDPCEVDDWESRNGAVSCQMTSCDGGCDLILFDMGGHVLPNYALEPVMNGETMTKDNSGEDPMTPGADTETTQATNLKDSPAVRATSVFAILAAALLAAVMA